MQKKVSSPTAILGYCSVQSFDSFQKRTWRESPTRRERKNICARFLAEAKIEQFCYGFGHPQV